MRKVSLLTAAALIVAAGSFVTTAQAKDKPNACKAHKTQAECTADKACSWNAPKNACKKSQ